MNHPIWTQYLQRFAALGADSFQQLKYKHAVRKFCVIIEPRQHPNLIPVIKNFSITSGATVPAGGSMTIKVTSTKQN
jgi:hypothetical protein